MIIKITSNIAGRAALYTSLFLLAWYAGVKIVGLIFFDIEAAYLSLGIIGYPLFLLFFLIADRKLNIQKETVDKRIIFILISVFITIIIYPLPILGFFSIMGIYFPVSH